MVTSTPDPEPTRLAKDISQLSKDLAVLMATDVRIAPVDVTLALFMTGMHLRDATRELGTAAKAVDPLAAEAAYHASEAFAHAAAYLLAAVERLQVTALAPPTPRGSVYVGRIVGEEDGDEPAG